MPDPLLARNVQKFTESSHPRRLGAIIPLPILHRRKLRHTPSQSWGTEEPGLKSKSVPTTEPVVLLTAFQCLSQNGRKRRETGSQEVGKEHKGEPMWRKRRVRRK